MQRYIENPVVDTTKTVPYFEPVILTDIPTEDIPFYYISQEGDRLDSISTLFYKTADNWWVIAKANNLANGSIAIPAGTKLFIPNI
jgi:hypothetical protein